MKKFLVTTVSAVSLLCASGLAFAAGGYNDVPPTDPQYLACQAYASAKWEGGNEASLVAGQTKVQAWCECLWNETDDDFKGSLVKFSESAKGASVNKKCEKHSGWQS
ncbi:hypothetical protein F6R98_08565 [Candidatus Methylospira mobilis]|uniref:DUF2282 domain-containing protein n=1 Tax=Candidatus Methylospira mobilis TaxID=1808979 RepID=A0A5Q0BKC2_9GAMM|nr:hypothetical protein [Candidatus Methylospira mobilis]QFY42671.1 hypothetical protein F6R98_08565 [Candidatus Methylospira mobilis]WNV04211.1 hypothetical protein RP726_17650 [Candidatus Methylospira mobilis]